MKKTLGPYDVLLGRGTGPNEHIGNIRYRASVRDLIEEVGLKALTNGGLTKSRLAKQVVDLVTEKGGVFLKKLPTASGNSESEGYVQVSRTMALDKTKQSFRHQLRGMLAKNAPVEKETNTRKSTFMQAKAASSMQKSLGIEAQKDVKSRSTPRAPSPQARKEPQALGLASPYALVSSLPSAEALLQLRTPKSLHSAFPVLSTARRTALPSSIALSNLLAAGSSSTLQSLSAPVLPLQRATSLDAVISHEQQKRAALLSSIAAAVEIEQTMQLERSILLHGTEQAIALRGGSPAILPSSSSPPFYG